LLIYSLLADFSISALLGFSQSIFRHTYLGLDEHWFRIISTMSSNDLSAKEAYFEEQSLLELSDDEQEPPSESYSVIDRALEDTKAMPPPTLKKQSSSFLGPTPKEQRQADFEAHAAKQRADRRSSHLQLVRSSTAPETELSKSFPVTKPRSGQLAGVQSANKLKRVSSLPNMTSVSQTPFYKQMGVVPRELRNGKNVKPADNIKLDPEHKQLLKDKIVYFYPNDDISIARRRRIHKLIQLGAAWVKIWREDITHIMLDKKEDGGEDYTYGQLLRHLNKPGLPVIFLLPKSTLANDK
jgi:DNA polymerase IV